jgi:hypothetical protein
MVTPSWCWRVTFFVLMAGARVLDGQSVALVPSSPCPKLFYYYKDSHTSQILGALHVPPPTDSVKIIIQAQFIVSVYFNTVRENIQGLTVLFIKCL